MIELLTNAEMAEADRLAIAAGVASATLMQRAGRAVADAVSVRHATGVQVAVVAGTGNNGGDGFVAARVLSERGYRVRVALFGERDRIGGDAAAAALAWRGEVVPATPQAVAGTDVVVDALFGAGLDRPVTGAAAALIEAVNAAAAVVAVDLPSGIGGSTGAVMGQAVRADAPVTFFRRKPAHLLLPGRLHCGRVHVADIGIPEHVLHTVRPRAFVNAPSLWRAAFPVPQVDGHDASRGHAVVMSGGQHSTGAARLAARGALRAGAGLVTIASPSEALAVNAAASLAVMVRPVDGAIELAELMADARKNALVLGPGGGVGTAMRDLVLTGLATRAATVLDADALTSFVDDPKILFTALRNRARSATILTPHEGEFSRIFRQKDGKTPVKQKLEEAREASHETAAVLLLKGADTVVAAPDGRAAIAENAPPWLATAGSGDVLAGMIAGLCAQGMPSFEAACAAVWLHGEAATRVGPGLIAEDLPEALPPLYRAMFAERGAMRR